MMKITGSRDSQGRRSYHPALVSGTVRFTTAFHGSALVLVLAGCATFRAAGRSSDSNWHQVTTPHFRVRTDFDDETAVEAAMKLEATRDALVSAAWPSFQFPEATRTDVYVLANGLDFERLFGRMTAGFFSPRGRPTFFLYGPPSRWDQRRSLAFESTSIVRHEMAHQLAAVVYAREPRWFSEGLAQFLETVHESEDHKAVIVGSVNIEAWRKYNTFRTITAKGTLEWTQANTTMSDAETDGFYGMSWVLVHFLYNTQPEPFARYQVELAKGTDPRRAWEIAFPNLDASSLDSQIRNYSRRGEYVEFPVQLHSTPVAATAEPLTPAETHIVRARLFRAAFGFASPTERGPRLQAAATELKTALELDPTNVEALEMEDRAPAGDRLTRARRAAAVHPDDPRVFRLLGALSKMTGADISEQENAYRQAVKLDPNDPGSLNNLAWLLLEQHKVAEALPLALRALKRAPFDGAIIDTYAVALFQAGRCESAIAHEEHALELQHDVNASSELARSLKRQLAEFKTACTEAKAEH